MSRALVTGWFGFEFMGATAGDIQTAELARDWLKDLDIPADLAVEGPFEGDVRLTDVDAGTYTHFLFVCGPFGENEMTRDLLERFSHCTRIGLNLTMLQPLEEWNPFDILLERDSSGHARADMAFQSEAGRVPVVGLILVHPQEEYGDRGRHEQVKKAFRTLLDQREAAVLPIDTRLDINAGGLRTSDEIEAVISRCDVVLTTRLHGTVLSLKNGVPPLVVDPISGGAKVMQQAELLHWPCRFRADEVEQATLLDAFDWCLGPTAKKEVVICRARAMELLHLQRIEFQQAVATHGTVGSQGD